MPIDVTCPGCLTRFKVSEKYAGRTGACPKCKGPIRVPQVGEVKIHAPVEFATGGKDAQGRLVLKPLTREIFKFTPLALGVIGGSALVLLVGSLFLGETLRGSAVVTALGLLCASPPIVVAGYNLLRDRELAPFEGRSYWTRIGICSLAFACGWGAYYILPEYLLESPFSLVLLAVPFVLIGSLTALACFEFSPENAFFLYAFYLVNTMLLRWAAGWPAIWSETFKALQ